MRHVLPLALALVATPALAQDGPPMRDPGSVPLPAAVERFGVEYDRLAATGRLPVVGPGATLEIRAAADRARIFLAYAQFDLDGDGAVSRAEYDRHADLTWGTDLGEREYAILEQEWAWADADRDGVVTLGEIHALALEAHPVPETGPLGPEAQAMLLMDLDNDGFVDWAEVEAVLESRGR